MYSSTKMTLKVFKKRIFIYDKKLKRKWFLSNNIKSKLKFFAYSLVSKKFGSADAKNVSEFLKGGY